MKSKLKGLDNAPNSIFRASKTVRNIINKKLKEEKDAQDAQDGQQQQILSVPPTSSAELDVNKNLSSFTLDIKQITTLVSGFNNYWDKDLETLSKYSEETKKRRDKDAKKQLDKLRKIKNFEKIAIQESPI